MVALATTSIYGPVARCCRRHGATGATSLTEKLQKPNLARWFSVIGSSVLSTYLRKRLCGFSGLCRGPGRAGRCRTPPTEDGLRPFFPVQTRMAVLAPMITWLLLSNGAFDFFAAIGLGCNDWRPIGTTPLGRGCMSRLDRESYFPLAGCAEMPRVRAEGNPAQARATPSISPRCRRTSRSLPNLREAGRT